MTPVNNPFSPTHIVNSGKHSDVFDMMFSMLSAAMVGEPCGSRVTCNPAPTDTDEDWLILVPGWELFWPVETKLLEIGFVRGGSLPTEEGQAIGTYDNQKFFSFTRGELNLIITADPMFYDRFMAATMVAKRLNLLNKRDRIDLFQAVLYANRYGNA